MVRTASTGAHVDRNGDVREPSRLGRSSRQSRRRRHMAIASAVRREHTEGQIAKSIESQTAKLPSDTFLWAAITAMRIRNAPDDRKAERQRVRGPVGADAA